MTAGGVLAPDAPRRRRRPSPASGRVTVIACGSIDRGDDGAAIAILDELDRGRRRLRSRTAVAGQLAVDELVRAASSGPVVVVDAAVGLAPGAVAELAFADLRRHASRALPRSSHELPIADVVGLAELLLGRALDGCVVVIGGRSFGYGAGLSPEVAAGLPRFAAAVRSAVERLAGPAERR